MVAGSVLVSNQAGAEPPLPAITAEQLIANVISAEKIPFSGQVEVATNIGLPDLSALQNVIGTQAASWTSLLTGTTTVQVAVDPKVGARAEIDSGTSAYVVVGNLANKDGWIYSSDTNKATHLVGAAAESTESPTPDATTPPTPQDIAKQAIDAITPSTTLTIDANQTIAGHAAYTLTLTPRDSGSLIASVTLAVDASTWFPVSVKVYSTMLTGTPALSVAFTSLTYATPAASLFAFTPPANATVTTTDLGQAAQAKPDETSPETTMTPPAVTVVSGEAWTSVAMVTGLPADMTAMLSDPSNLGGLIGGGTMNPSAMPSDSPMGPMNGPMDQPGHHGNQDAMTSVAGLLGQLAQQTPEGVAYSTYLFSVLITPSGHIYAGAVPVSTLQAAARANG